MDHPELEQLPEKLREEVELYLALEPYAKILTVRADRQRVYVEYLNILTVFWFHEDFESLGVMKDSMLASDIDFFLEYSSWFKGRNQSGD